MPISEDKNEWALAKIEKEPLEDQYNFIIKLDQKIIFTGQNPQDAASQYMKYYEETNGKEILIDGYEIFGMYSLILWKIWQIYKPMNIPIFGNILRLKQKAELPNNLWINTENPSGIIDPSGYLFPSIKNIEATKDFLENDNSFDMKMILKSRFDDTNT